MKISEMITEEMVREILLGKIPNTSELGLLDDRYLTFHPTYEGFGHEYDLARFLFVDAWDYFKKKGWRIEFHGMDTSIAHLYPFVVNSYHVINEQLKCTDYEKEFIISNNHYPSHLHALAAAVAYMWEQEEKKEC